jgi:hypothetical protein
LKVIGDRGWGGSLQNCPVPVLLDSVCPCLRSAKTNNVLCAVSGQVWVASSPNTTGSGSASVVPLSVAAKTAHHSPPIGEDGSAGERQPVGAVHGRLAVSANSPSVAVLGSGFFAPSTQAGLQTRGGRPSGMDQHSGE